MSGSGRRSWAEEMAQLGVQMMTLPFRLFGAGLQAMAQAMEGAQRTPGQDLEPWRGMSASPNVTFSAAGPAVPTGRVEEAFASRVVANDAAAEDSKTKGKEDRDMSCCEQDLSGCDLKIVQYTIASVDPYLRDTERILLGPEVVAVSEDMTDADFTAYAISTNLEKHRERFYDFDTQYLRVCYFVMCRLTMPCKDYEKDSVKAERNQVRVLEEINRTLEGIRANQGQTSGPPATVPASAPPASARQPGGTPSGKPNGGKKEGT